MPWTRLESWPGDMELLCAEGFVNAALALSDDSVSFALVLGIEGDGLRPATVAATDLTVRIPLVSGVDSLNVAAAAAVAFWPTRVPLA